MPLARALTGVTWQAFHTSRACLDGGLSSRCIGGESGPFQQLSGTGRALALDALLVPLYRKMAAYADASASGRPMAEAEVAKNPFRAA